jgi:L-2-hydroxyglutarate oxidase LhgO
VRAKLCPAGNQMFPALDKELKFGYLKNGSLVCATSAAEEKVLEELLARGKTNGVKNLRIVDQAEVRRMEPHINANVTKALHAADAGTVTPYEFAIALCESAADNGVDVRIRHEVVGIERNIFNKVFTVSCLDWDPALGADGKGNLKGVAAFPFAVIAASLLGVLSSWLFRQEREAQGLALALLGLALFCHAIIQTRLPPRGRSEAGTRAGAVHATLAFAPGNAGRMVEFRARFVVNCAGLFADKVAAMADDHSFKIKPRLGDYLLLHKNQGHLARHTLFPCPDPKLGKGVLVQTTLWGNLILGPTARDTYDDKALKMSDKEVFEYILRKCRELVPALDAGEVIHSFCGARAKSDRGDWIIEQSAHVPGLFHAAGIDSPGLAGSPAIALEIVRLLKEAGLECVPEPNFDPVRRPLVVPKNGWKTRDGKNIKVWKEGQKPGDVPADQNVLCKCEKVTELEITNALRSSLVVDNTQAVRRRTRAGMGHCQAGEHPHCEQRVAELIAREKKIQLANVGRRPWPATSLLPQRWLSDEQKAWFRDLVK